MSKKLAIRGDAKRGNEIITLLKMLGGRNIGNYHGISINSVYFIDTYTNICSIDVTSVAGNYIIFTLDEFYTKYPYKVGDQVIIDGYDYLLLIVDMKWEDNTIKYLVSDDNSIVVGYTTEQLKGFKTISKMDNMETKVEGMIINFDICTEDEVEIKLGDYEIEVRDGKTYAVKKPVYPKTYDDCCNRLDANEFVEYELMTNFPKLINARNAYWKIAGEQMGLNKPWKPDWTTSGQDRYTIETNYDMFIFSKTQYGHRVVLVFPTTEMRDAFYKNFKELIEACKELL